MQLHQKMPSSSFRIKPCFLPAFSLLELKWKLALAAVRLLYDLFPSQAFNILRLRTFPTSTVSHHHTLPQLAESAIAVPIN